MIPSEYISGLAFGSALVGSGVYLPEIIKGQMNFSVNSMLMVFMGASATSSIVLEVADRRNVLTKQHRAPSGLGSFAYGGNIVGGALIGVGMATTGACPGTAVAQMGSGMANGIVAVVGGLLGAMLVVRWRENCARNATIASTTTGNLGSDSSRPPGKSLDMATALSIQPLTMVCLWVPMCLAIIGFAKFLDRTVPQPSGVTMAPPSVGGLLIGLAQAATVLFTHRAIGVSTAYGDVARWLDFRLFGSYRGNSEAAPSFVTPSIMFSAGITTAAAVFRYYLFDPPSSNVGSIPMDPLILARTLAGGASMVGGALIAGGTH